MDWEVVLTLSITVLLALLGYGATYAYNLKLARREDRLSRVSRQLSDFYGPLFALSESGASIWNGFRTQYRPGGKAYWDPTDPPSAAEAEAWRLWITEVFMPLNRQMVDVIVQKADLLDEAEMPEVLLEVCSHVAAYEAVLKQWTNGDFSRNTSVVDFPRCALVRYTRESFRRLKSEQNRLLGEVSAHV
jgi:hypothetical protein